MDVLNLLLPLPITGLLLTRAQTMQLETLLAIAYLLFAAFCIYITWNHHE